MDKALQTQLANIEKRTGKSIDQLAKLVKGSGLTKHGAIRDWLKSELKMGQAGLRPIHDAVMQAVSAFGPFEIAPKKTYLSLRRKKQFAMVGPTTNTRVEVGLNMKGVPGTARLEALPPGGMCQYRVRLASAGEVDEELLGWIQNAYNESA